MPWNSFRWIVSFFHYYYFVFSFLIRYIISFLCVCVVALISIFFPDWTDNNGHSHSFNMHAHKQTHRDRQTLRHTHNTRTHTHMHRQTVALEIFIKQNHCCVLPVFFGIRVLFFVLLLLLLQPLPWVDLYKRQKWLYAVTVVRIQIHPWNNFKINWNEFSCYNTCLSIPLAISTVVLTVIVLTFIWCRHQ